jgi:hypothetical protein
MSYPPQPPVTPGPDESYSLGQMMPPPPPRKTRTGLFVGVAAAVLVAAGLAAGAVLLVAGDSKKEPAAAAAPSPSSTCPGYSVDASTGAVVCKPAGADPVANPGPQYAVPNAADFKVTVKILEKKCFGSAGCNITYRIDPQYVGELLDPAATWLVTYEVHGVEDGPQINTFEVTGSEASFEAEEIAQTASSKAKLTVKVTDVQRD